jgi:hypothetical protein
MYVDKSVSNLDFDGVNVILLLIKTELNSDDF